MALVNDLFVTTTEGDFLFLLNFGITFSEKYVIKQDVFDHVCHFDISSKCTRELLSNILPKNSTGKQNTLCTWVNLYMLFLE